MARIKSINFPNSEGELSNLFDKLQRASINGLLVSGALAIKAAGNTLAKTAAAIYYLIDGQLYTKAAADASALVGTVTNAKFNVFMITVNAAGTFKSYMGIEAATLGAVALPAVPDGETAVGLIVINPTGTGNFVGGTTALDDATVVPNAVYINTVTEFFPALATL